MSTFFAGAFGVAAALALLAFAIIQIWAGFVGVEYHLGFWWAVGALGIALFARIMLPLTIGAFFGVTDVWGYHWMIGLLVAAPGLLFMVPGLIGAAIAGIRGRAGA